MKTCTSFFAIVAALCVSFSAVAAEHGPITVGNDVFVYTGNPAPICFIDVVPETGGYYKGVADFNGAKVTLNVNKSNKSHVDLCIYGYENKNSL